tara:strand:+ start:173 stop:850 length:678 start_codon:yes stop_codon:yes gene_type:complete
VANSKNKRRIKSAAVQGRRCSKKLKSEILEMHQNGYSYNKIREVTSLSKGTICYHLGKNQKQKTLERTRKIRSKPGGTLRRKMYLFRERFLDYDLPINNTGRTRNFYFKFCEFMNNPKGDKKPMFKELLEHLWPGGCNDKREDFWHTCALSGADINLNAGKEDKDVGALDHKMPRSRGGSNDFSNCQPLSARVNQMKSDMTNEEFIEQCKKILSYQGYEIKTRIR